ncbi:MAG: fibronectin type III domain-containing protein, partial [Eubacterium sp.]
TTQTTGYQIQYSTSSKFTSKTTKTVTVSKNKTTSKTISKLKAKKKYYVRVRTYKIVSGKKIYSAWSKAKTVTTKK